MGRILLLQKDLSHWICVGRMRDARIRFIAHGMVAAALDRQQWWIEFD
jgi:hypothetical protein